MKIYTLTKKQFLPITLDEAWAFFSTPINLKKITPEYMGFNILTDLGDGKMYPGQIIHYIVTPVLGIPMRWTTEITHVIDRKYFVDEQRFGPYSFWHHQHWFREVDGGVEMTDIVNYGIPLGVLGRIANTIFVRSKLQEIFDYREKVTHEMFGKKSQQAHQV
jgi:ligand-binding SRPBCC domain-containing protein